MRVPRTLIADPGAEAPRIGPRQAHVAVLTCWLAFLGHALGLTVFGPMVPLMEAHFQTSKSGIATLFAVSAAGFLLSVALGSSFLRHLGLGGVLRIGSGGFALSMLHLGQARSLSAGLFSMAALGFLGGFIQVGANAAVATAFPRNRALSLNLLHLFFGLGALTGPRLVPWVLAGGSRWTAVLPWASSASILAFLLALLARFPSAPAPRGAARSLRHALAGPLRELRWVLLVMACYVGTEISLNNWGPAYMQEHKGLGLAASAAGISHFWLAMSVGRLLCAPLTRRFGAGRLLRALTLAALMATTAFLLVPTPWMVSCSLIAAGLFFSGIFPTLLGLAGDAFPDEIPRLTSAVMMAASMGSMLFPWLVGVLGDRYGLDRGLLLSPLLLTVVLVASWRLARRLSAAAAAPELNTRP